MQREELYYLSGAFSDCDKMIKIKETGKQLTVTDEHFRELMSRPQTQLTPMSIPLAPIKSYTETESPDSLIKYVFLFRMWKDYDNICIWWQRWMFKLFLSTFSTSARLQTLGFHNMQSNGPPTLRQVCQVCRHVLCEDCSSMVVWLCAS